MTIVLELNGINILEKNIKIVVIDDLLNRRFETDIYLNFRLDSTKEFKEKLTKLINKDSVKLIGPEYCIFDNKLKKESINHSI